VTRLNSNPSGAPAQTEGDASPAAVPTPAQARPNSVLTWIATPAARALIALALILLLGVIFNSNGTFFKSAIHRDALREASIYGILACGMTLVIISGGIDLAVGSVLALVAVSFSIFTINWGWSGWLAIPAVLLLGACTGAISGSLTSWGRLQPFIATLAMFTFARGLAKYLTGGSKVLPKMAEDYTVNYPPVFTGIDQRILGGNVSVVTLIFIACALFSYVLLARHRFGRQLYAVGGNEKAAALSGVPVNRVKTTAYVLSGFFAAVAGICQSAQERQGDPNTGAAYELTAIAIVVIGGTNLMGGRGGIGLTVLGTLTIGYLSKILSINQYSDAGRQMLTGLIIVIAVLAQRKRA
jgi:ribose transport system permease protein